MLLLLYLDVVEILPRKNVKCSVLFSLRFSFVHWPRLSGSPPLPVPTLVRTGAVCYPSASCLQGLCPLPSFLFPLTIILVILDVPLGLHLILSLCLSWTPPPSVRLEAVPLYPCQGRMEAASPRCRPEPPPRHLAQWQELLSLQMFY